MHVNSRNGVYAFLSVLPALVCVCFCVFYLCRSRLDMLEELVMSNEEGGLATLEAMLLAINQSKHERYSNPSESKASIS